MCRKYNHDYFARKSFLNHIIKKNKVIQEQMEESSKTGAIEYQVLFCCFIPFRNRRKSWLEPSSRWSRPICTTWLPPKYSQASTTPPMRPINLRPLMWTLRRIYRLRSSRTTSGNRLRATGSRSIRSNDANRKMNRLAKEEFAIRKKLLQINKGISIGTHDPVSTIREKQKEPTKTVSARAKAK